MNATVIVPYVFEEEVRTLVQALSKNMDIPYIVEKDEKRIGSDLMYQKLWGKCNTDIIILHSDMASTTNDTDNNWYTELCNYADTYKEAGLIGCKLLYPVKINTGHYLIQSAGGKFINNRPDHFGSGYDIFTGKHTKEPEADTGQYDFVREVAWSTFGGIYIRREVLNQVGHFDSSFEHQYNRDVDYCLEARNRDWKIYQVPTTLLHFESKDNKRIRNESSYAAEARNLLRLQEKWKNSQLMNTIDKKIDDTILV